MCRQYFFQHVNKFDYFCQKPGWLSRHSDSLQARRSGDLFPVGTRYSALVQNGPGAHPASYTVGTGSFPGVKRPGCGVDHPLTSSADEVKEKVELYLYSTFGPSWPVIGWTLPYFCQKRREIFQHQNGFPATTRRWKKETKDISRK